jgi:RNA polymerase sigma-70 factor (ECF subfamily)
LAQDHGGPDRDARFAAVVERYGRLLRDAVARVFPRHLGLQFEDVEQEARLRLWKALESEREVRDLASYIYRVAATTTIDAIRRVKARREEPLELDDPAGPARPRPVPDGVDGEAVLGRRLLLEKVERVMAGLDGRRSQVLRLHFQGFTTTEMGALLGSSEASARNLLHRGLKELRERLREEGITYAGE